MLDLTNATLTVLFAVGAVNAVLLFKPDIDSKWKFVISIVAAFLATLIPADLGAQLLNSLKEAIAAAIIGSGVYKLASKAGGE